jgi:hypothetical protein
MLASILIGGILAAEWVLGWQYQRIARSDRLTPGLTVPDPKLGWKLTPGWRGTHAHHDFNAAYSINGIGFRGADIRFHPAGARKIAVVGDSFTFGTGVNDDEIFTHLLDGRAPQSERVYNFAVPGFSTDQELLLIERDVLPVNPTTVIVVVYLFNDLFDNQLPAALQVRHQKPMFTLERGQLVLKPFAFGASDESAGGPTLLDMVYGNQPGGSTMWQRMEGRSHLFRVVRETLLPPRIDDASFDSRQTYAFELFWALIARLQESCRAAGASFAIALMGGRTFVESPSGLSAQFQEAFRSRLVAEAAAHDVEVIDIAGSMRSRYAQSGSHWFHPNEGHLNTDGHRVVAEIVGTALASRRFTGLSSGR